MNIKKHIEAGRYPKDAKGRALVPSSDGQTVTIYATDAPCGACIVGYRPTHGIYRWSAAGTAGERGTGWTLLPPPPRKVEVKKFILHHFAKGAGYHMYETREDAEAAMRGMADVHVVELTGSYEIPWE